jgi:flavin reductase (DIM6/NTAB) family NADH-FMN oxidoreductase RutF
MRQCLRTIRTIAFGDTLLPQEFTIGLENPQAEVSLWLRAGDLTREVTGRQTTACTSPLRLCVAFHDAHYFNQQDLQRAVLRFCEYGKPQRVLGEIRLRPDTTLSIGASKFVLFGVRGSANHCLPAVRIWMHYLLHAYSHWRRNDPPDMKMTLIEERAATVTFIHPHPLSLVSVGNRSSGNIFTMNLMGDLGNGYFGFALRDRRVVADLVEHTGRVAISGIPLTECALAFQLAANYKKESVDWEELPFETEPSTALGIPVPRFATGVKELEIVEVHRIGGHRLFLARLLHDEVRPGKIQACVVHGFYQFWRTKGDREKLRASIAEDSLHKRGQ